MTDYIYEEHRKDNDKKSRGGEERAFFRCFHLLMNQKERSRAHFPMKYGWNNRNKWKEIDFDEKICFILEKYFLKIFLFLNIWFRIVVLGITCKYSIFHISKRLLCKYFSLHIFCMIYVNDINECFTYFSFDIIFICMTLKFYETNNKTIIKWLWILRIEKILNI